MLPELAPGLHHAYMVDATEVMKIPFSAWFKQNTGYEYKGTVFIYVAGIFAMSKQQILTRPQGILRIVAETALQVQCAD
jgi:hypothetical protein